MNGVPPWRSDSPKAKRLEFRCPDPSCNGYIMFSAMLMAMVDGIKNKIDPGEPLEGDIYEMTAEELAHGILLTFLVVPLTNKSVQEER